MTRNDPYSRIQRQQLWTLGITIPLLTLAALLQLFNPRNELFIKVGFLLIYAIVLIAGGIAIFRYRSKLKRLDQRRERALQGDRSLLAREQPLPDPHILPIPTTIKLDQSRRAVVALSFAIAFIIFIAFVIGIVAGSVQRHSNSSSNILVFALLAILGGAVFAVLIALVLIFYIMRTQLIFTIKVDEQGLTSTYQGVTASINWSDARLFAVLSPDRPFAMRFYELSNERTVVRWAKMPARALLQRKENKRFVEYRCKVEALHSFIVARMGLSLYDLSPSK